MEHVEVNEACRITFGANAAASTRLHWGKTKLQSTAQIVIVLIITFILKLALHVKDLLVQCLTILIQVYILADDDLNELCQCCCLGI